MRSQRAISLLFVFAAIAASIGCQRVRPEAPLEAEFEPPVPNPVSYVAGEVTFNIRDLETKINQSLGPVLVTEETFEGRKGEAWRLRVERTGPVRIHYANQRVSVSTDLQVWYSNPISLRKQAKRRPRPLCALAVEFASPLAVASNWRLVTRSRFENYRWIQQPAVRVLGVRVSVTKLAEKILDKRKPEIEAAIDRAVHQELRLDRHVSRIWRDMQRPLRISRTPDEIWIVPRPFSIAAAPVYGNAQRITVPLQIAFRVNTHFGPRPDTVATERLPRLLRRAKLPEASRLQVLAFIPYADMNRVLSRRMNEQKIDLMGGYVTIKNATIYGNGLSLIVRTDVGGAVNGTLYFRGQPQYDTLTNTLRVQNVDFDVDTKERLFATADWLLHDHLRDTLQAALVVPLRQRIDELPDKIETAFSTLR